jgi:hypothetical protein
MTEMKSGTQSGPTQIPAQGGGQGNVASLSGGAGTSAPADLTAEQLQARLGGSAVAAAGAPTLAPPSSAAGAQAGVTATWRTGVQITALWSIDETRNAFAYVDGVGWKKLFNGRDGAFAALATLASQARQTGRTVNLREEADGMIYEIYLW